MPRKARPTTPSMMLGPLGGPNSPPQTPTSTTPMINYKYAARHQPPWHNLSHPTLLEESGIQPTGNGHEFSFTPSNRFAQLSPRTSSEDSESDEDEEVSESESESGSGSEEDEAMQAVTKDDDEEEDSDDEEEDSDDDDESEDEDDDVPMNFRPQDASVPKPAPIPAPMVVPGTAAMAVDSSSEEESDEEEDEEDDDSDFDLESESQSVVTPPTQEIPQESHSATATAAAAAKANFTLEELSDFDPMDQDRTGTIAPSGFSSPASARSRSRAPAPRELPPGLERRMRDLNCGLSSSEESDEDVDEDVDEDEAAHREFVRMQRELRMRKRRSHGSSIGKRTISERSDSDHEDWTPLDPDAVGSSARRLRRRVGDRRSFIHPQFQDPPPPRIDELEEPESEVEGTFIFCDSGTLAQELPYYSIEIMEYSTPSP